MFNNKVEILFIRKWKYTLYILNSVFNIKWLLYKGPASQKVSRLSNSLVLQLRGWMCYWLRRCLYSEQAHSDLSTVLPLTETSRGKPPLLAHSAHVLLSRAEQLSAAPSCPVSCAAPNEAWRPVSSPLQPGPHGENQSDDPPAEPRSKSLANLLSPPLWFEPVSPSTSCSRLRS